MPITHRLQEVLISTDQIYDGTCLISRIEDYLVEVQKFYINIDLEKMKLFMSLIEKIIVVLIQSSLEIDIKLLQLKKILYS